MRLATHADLDRIMMMIDETKALLHARGNWQWDENYPLRGHFSADVDEGSLYILEQDGEIAGIICVNGVEADEYRAVQWTKPGPALVIHRMAVAPKFRARGLAHALIDFAVAFARERGYPAIRTDTYSGNEAMLALLRARGFVQAGVVELANKKCQPYCCFEKSIEV